MRNRILATVWFLFLLRLGESSWMDAFGLTNLHSRQPRRIINRIPTFADRAPVRYPLCKTGNSKGACLSDISCSRAGGRFAGYCGLSDGVCCIVEETCGGRTGSHVSMFMNPNYPRKENEARVCPFTISVSRGICAIRLDFDVFELAPYDDGLCIRDTLTILGSKGGVATPVCGNMTNYATTFEVNAFDEIVLAMVTQGVPAHRFSIQVTQMPCRDITTFQSPTLSGIRNSDAPEYTTTLAPSTTTTTSTDKNSNEEEEEEDVTTTEESISVTRSTSDDIQIWDTDVKEENNAKEKVITQTDGDGVYRETLVQTPSISAFKRGFEQQFMDTCWEDAIQYSFRVIGGAYANKNEYPWQVALVYKKKFFCGGSLISDRHILTAAHCIFGSFSSGLEHLRVILGDHDLTMKNESVNIVTRVKKVFWHLNYSPHTTSNDIAMFELEAPVTFSYSIAAIKLPSDIDDTFENVNATVTGWGRYTVKEKTTSTILREYTGPLYNITECVDRWHKFPLIEASKEMHICMSVERGTPCHGDSGGPLVVCTGLQCTQVGVVSFGFPLCTNVGLPAVFTRVTSYRRWIDITLTDLGHITV